MSCRGLPLHVSTVSGDYAPAFPGVLRLRYGLEDGGDDWALAWPGTRDVWVVHLHGHGSTGDQLFTRPDLRDAWLTTYRRRGYGILSPNLRGNAWMCPAAVDDLHRLLAWTRRAFAVRAFVFISGSMGGTSNLIYATQHPEDVHAVMALCPATDIAAYATWCRHHPGSVRDDIYRAITHAYGGTPEEQPERYGAHSALRHAACLTMPVLVCHGDADPTIPVEESRRLAAAMNAPLFSYRELPGGDHDAPLHAVDMDTWLEDNTRCESSRGLPCHSPRAWLPDEAR